MAERTVRRSTPAIVDIETRQTVTRMARWSDEQLYQLIARRIIRQARKQTLAGRRRATLQRVQRARGVAVRQRLAIDTETLEALRRALRSQPSTGLGEEWFQRIWNRIKGRVCVKWRLCEKLHEYDDELLLLILLIGFLLKERFGILSDIDLIAATVLLAWHRGPEWMCKCPKKIRP
jgi:hypothetical protein